MSAGRAVAALLAGLCLASCAVGPDYTEPDTAANAQFSMAPDFSAEDVLSGAAVDEAWWLSFDDEMLVHLVDRAIQSNTDIRAATARVQEARALRRSALARVFPALDAGGEAARSQSSEAANLPPGFPALQTLFGVGLTAAWEIDFFGRLRRGVEASNARYEATLEDRRHLLLLVLSEVALNYADLRSAQQQSAVARRNIEVAERTLKLAELLRGRELAGELDVLRARAEVTEARASLAQFAGYEGRAVAQLAALLGAESRDLQPQLTDAAPLGLKAPPIPAGLASDLLRRRADVRAAERRLAASSAEIGLQIAQRFPSFSLSGGLGPEAAELDDLFSAPSEAWNIAGALRWPVFDAGRRRADARAAEARHDAAMAAYDGAVYAALADAEAAFASYAYAATERRTLERALADRERGLHLARLRFGAELDDLFPVLDAQRQLLSIESRVAAAARAELIAAINVYRALGGGWTVAEQRLGEVSP